MKTDHPYTSETALPPEQLAAYHRDGYLILRGLFTPREAECFQAEASRLQNSDYVDPNNLRTPMAKREDGVTRIERFDPVQDISDLFHRVVTDERIMHPLYQIFEGEACLFKDKLIFKDPGVQGYSMHQDYAWWQPQGNNSPLPKISADQILSVMVAIDAADALNGAIEVFPGYHDRLITPPGLLTNMRKEEAEQIDLSKGILGMTAPGDVIIFHSLTPHRSGSNRSTGSRRQLYMTYNARIGGDVYDAQLQHYHNYRTNGMTPEAKASAFFR